MKGSLLVLLLLLFLLLLSGRGGGGRLFIAAECALGLEKEFAVWCNTGGLSQVRERPPEVLASLVLACEEATKGYGKGGCARGGVQPPKSGR